MKSASGWGFPRGKVNAGEEEIVCAAREVLEETGIDVEHLIVADHKIQVWQITRSRCMCVCLEGAMRLLGEPMETLTKALNHQFTLLGAQPPIYTARRSTTNYTARHSTT